MKLYDKKNVAEFLNITPRRVGQLADEGILKEYGGRYKLKECIADYIEYLQNQISDRDYTSDYNTERAKLTRAKREKEEMEFKLRQNELHLAEDIELVMGNIIISFRNKMMTIPQKALNQLMNAKKSEEIMEILEIAINEALNELSEYDPKLFEKEEMGDG